MLTHPFTVACFDFTYLYSSNEPENNFGLLDPALMTLMDIKNAWHAHPLTCLKVSSADILQFAGFFATTRNKNGPESLTSGSLSANAKRSTLRNDFLWGRLDENACDIAWTDNLPGFQMTSGGPIPARCTGAGEEIRKKMMDRNGFTAGKKDIGAIELLVVECISSTVGQIMWNLKR
jgi:hypothetical protein